MIYFEAPYITVRWDEEINSVIAEWRGFANSQNYRIGAEKEIELVAEKKASRLLSDVRQIRVIDIADQTWTLEEWGPRIVKVGLRKLAVLVPEDIFGQMSLRRMKNQAKTEILQTAYFDKEEAARQWLVAK